MEKKIRLYRYIAPQFKETLSLNYLLSEKTKVDFKSMDIKTKELPAICSPYNDMDFDCTIYVKHISRMVENIHKIEITNI